MEGLLAILRAAYCRSTHHYFALDALRHVRTDAGRAFARMLLKYHAQYLSGAKEPDTRFRDFQNHVVHVADDHWGGAPRAAERWYGRLQQFLRQGAWADAANAAGILSHYFTDPLQPLHTDQSAREAVVHRPLEWSVCKSYDEIMARWRDDRFRIVFRLSSRSDWLGAAMLRGADLAHRSYETLVATYDLNAAQKNPRHGLSEASMDALAELFGVAITGWARVIERTAQEAEGHLPDVKLVPSTIMATVKLPIASITQRLYSQREKKAVLELLDYYLTTGELGPHTPDEVRLVRKVLAVRNAEREYERSRMAQNEVAKEEVLENERTDQSHQESSTEESAGLTLRIVTIDSATSDQSIDEPEPKGKSLAGESSLMLRRSKLTLASPIVDAPSIGPKTASRFEQIGIMNIGQFLGSSPEHLVHALKVRWIGVQQISDWQSQTRLMMALPIFRVRDVQLLVAVGCRTAYLLESSDPESLYDQIVRYSKSPLGKRMLRGANPPKIQEVRSWVIESGHIAKAA